MYCSIIDIKTDINDETRLIELTNASSGGGETVKDSIITAKIVAATDEINSYIPDVYTLPITNTADLSILKDICVSLVVCGLFQTKYQMDPPEGLIIRQKTALSKLDKIQKKVMKLHSPSTGGYIEQSGARVTPRTKIFTDDMLYDAL